VGCFVAQNERGGEIDLSRRRGPRGGRGIWERDPGECGSGEISEEERSKKDRDGGQGKKKHGETSYLVLAGQWSLQKDQGIPKE